MFCYNDFENIQEMPDAMNNRLKKTGCVILVAGMLMSFPLTGCAKSNDAEGSSEVYSGGMNGEDAVTRIYLEGFDTFEVTSEDVVDGVWLDVISNTDIGENSSPELKWEPVEGATEYVIYMVDRNSNGFLHWKSGEITETDLPRGSTQGLTEYYGPHVGHGYTHNYDIYVIALRAPVDRIKGAVNCMNAKLDEFILDLDTDIYGNTGNIIAYGVVSGTFTDCRFRDTEPSGYYIM